jgi:hypothetical protein
MVVAQGSAGLSGVVPIASPADHRLTTEVTPPNQVVSGSFTAIAGGRGVRPLDPNRNGRES